MNLQDFFAHYSTPSNAPMYLQNVQIIWKPYLKQAKNNPFICLEMYIDIATMNKLLEYPENGVESNPADVDRMLRSTLRSVTNRERGRTESIMSTGNHYPAKQIRASGVPVSEFGLQPARGPSVIHQQNKIVLKKITLKMDASSGAVCCQKVFKVEDHGKEEQVPFLMAQLDFLEIRKSPDQLARGSSALTKTFKFRDSNLFTHRAQPVSCQYFLDRTPSVPTTATHTYGHFQWQVGGGIHPGSRELAVKEIHAQLDNKSFLLSPAVMPNIDSLSALPEGWRTWEFQEGSQAVCLLSFTQKPIFGRELTIRGTGPRRFEASAWTGMGCIMSAGFGEQNGISTTSEILVPTQGAVGIRKTEGKEFPTGSAGPLLRVMCICIAT
ncbi:hypothetical protein K438DRAFT_1780691 [Mycena galopus ATCC 62051]|nr:hypothetical protein K438DRAFT_1780691 [Mycena galopus ATCC 62051]